MGEDGKDGEDGEDGEGGEEMRAIVGARALEVRLGKQQTLS